jgi:hypothetical protein
MPAAGSRDGIDRAGNALFGGASRVSKTRLRRAGGDFVSTPRSVAVLLGLSLAGTYAPPALGWGAEGHSIVAELAQRRLTPQAASAVAALLGPQVSLASVASWADGQRSLHPETGNWHFVDIPLAADTYDPSRDCAPSAVHGDCIIAELQRTALEMRCARTPELRRDALRYAVHFVGDIHQPLHTVGDAQGGNQFAVHGALRGSTCRRNCELAADTGNLHALWDTTLIRRTVWDWGSYVTRLEEGLMLSPEVGAGATGDTPLAWALQSHAVAQAVWNAQRIPADGAIDDAYYQAVLPLLDRQLALAGMHLAAFLNAALAPGSCPAPVAPGTP